MRVHAKCTLAMAGFHTLRDECLEESFRVALAWCTFMACTVIENLAGPSAFIRTFPAVCQPVGILTIMWVYR